MAKLWRNVLLPFIDLFVTVDAILLAFAIRFVFDDRAIPVQYLAHYFDSLLLILPVRLLIFSGFGLYRQMWRHASVPELMRILGAVTVDSLLSTAILFGLSNVGFPRSVIVIGWFLKVGGLGAVRLALRIRYEWSIWRRSAVKGSGHTLIFGAGDAGAMVAREFTKHPELNRPVVGFIDDDPGKKGYRIAGAPVLGDRLALPEVVQKLDVTHLLIAAPSVRGSVIREVVEAGRSLGLQIQTLPGIYEMVSGTVSVSQIRDVQIEDLLGREEVQVDLEAIAAYLTGETVLVTGAGGSIGSELCRQVARFGPKQLVLVGHGENSIYEIDMELRRTYPGMDVRPIIADVQDETRIRRIFEMYRPGVVFHAAAHKHVPLMEANPEEAIKNNVFGTLNVARAADFYRAKRFVLISSDKAVNPTSVMGATKRAAEYVIQSLSRTSQTVFVAVRFGNVLGSRGSVIPLFKKQIAAGGPVTITDRRMIRYFMTIPEAVRLVIQAASMGEGGEVFVLDMGKPVKIVDLARDLIRLSGFEPEREIEILETGIRPGEKLYEEILTAEEGTVATHAERIYVSRGDAITPIELQQFLEQMREIATKGQVSNGWVLGLVTELAERGMQHGVVTAGH